MKAASFCFFLITALSFFSHTTFSQDRAITEDDIGFEILKWHYHFYPNNSNSTWRIVGRGNDELYRADFEFEEQEITAFYNSEGEIVSEEIDLRDKVPVSLIHYLDDLYPKYKITSFLKITTVTGNMEKTIVHELGVKDKEHGNFILRFDKDLIPFPDNLLTNK